MIPANLILLRNNHLLHSININSEIRIFPNEKFYISVHKTQSFLWSLRTVWLELPVSTSRLEWHILIIQSLYFQTWAPNDDKVYFFISDYDLSTVCHDFCVEETFNCILTCDSSDSDCVYQCLRAEVTCVESTFFNLIFYQILLEKWLNCANHLR